MRERYHVNPHSCGLDVSRSRDRPRVALGGQLPDECSERHRRGLGDPPPFRFGTEPGNRPSVRAPSRVTNITPSLRAMNLLSTISRRGDYWYSTKAEGAFSSISGELVIDYRIGDAGHCFTRVSIFLRCTIGSVAIYS
jgi:hypothetical protein